MSHATKTSDAMRRQGWCLCSEAARLTEKSVQTLYRWIDDPSIRVSGMNDGYRRYVRWNELLDHLGKEYAKALKLQRW